MDSRLYVTFEARLVGELDRLPGDRMAFTYAGEWLRGLAPFAVSHSLPLGPDPFLEAGQAYFANLLPEGAVRETVARGLGISPANDFELLARLGRDCAGALCILTEGEPPDDPVVPERDRIIPEEELQRWMKRRFELARVMGSRGVRLSLAGAQDKIALRLGEDGELRLQEGATASTHVLKKPDPDHKHLPANEVLMSRVGEELDLGTCRSTLREVAGVPVALVERFDRDRDEDRVRRRHQEDLCQALGYPSTRKYEEEGGPGIRDAVELVREVSVDPLRDVLRLLRWEIFNALAGNADGHAKNVALLRSADGLWRLAPFYDLVCTRVYPRLSRHLAMGVGGERDPGQIARRHWEAMARDLDIGPRLVIQEVERQIAELPPALERSIEWFRTEFGSSPVLDRIRACVARQVRRSRSLLA